MEKKAFEKENGWIDRLVKNAQFSIGARSRCAMQHRGTWFHSVFTTTMFLPDTQQQHKISVSVHNSPSRHDYFACIQILLFSPDRNMYQSNRA